MQFRHVLTILCVLMKMGCAMPLDQYEAIHVKKSIGLLSKKNSSDEAYSNLISIGLPAIPMLIENFDNTAVFEGIKIYNYTSSLLVEKPTVGLVSLYLVDCIIFNNETPHTAPLISKKNSTINQNSGKLPETEAILIKEAAEHYKKWWDKTKGLKRSQIKKESPLLHTNLTWWGQ